MFYSSTFSSGQKLLHLHQPHHPLYPLSYTRRHWRQRHDSPTPRTGAFQLPGFFSPLQRAATKWLESWAKLGDVEGTLFIARVRTKNSCTYIIWPKQTILKTWTFPQTSRFKCLKKATAEPAWQLWAVRVVLFSTSCLPANGSVRWELRPLDLNPQQRHDSVVQGNHHRTINKITRKSKTHAETIMQGISSFFPSFFDWNLD